MNRNIPLSFPIYVSGNADDKKNKSFKERLLLKNYSSSTFLY